MNKGQILFAKHLRELGVVFREQEPVSKGRKWRWDFYLPRWGLAIEIDGFFRGRHGAGWGGDYEKQNVGTLLGYRVLRFTTREVERGDAKQFLAEWIGGKNVQR